MRLLIASVLILAAYGQVEQINDLDAVERRARQLRRLIEEDPARALSFALPDTALAALRSRFPEAAALIETRGEWEGPLTVLVQEDLERHQSRTVRRIRIDGYEVEVHWPDAPQSSCAHPIRLRGIRLGDQIAVETALDASATTATSPCTVTGRQNVAVLLVNYKGTKLPSWLTPSAANNAFFGNGWSMDNFWRENSFGVTTASGNVFGPFELNADYTCAQTDALQDAAIQAADAVADLRSYTRLFIVAPSTPDCGWSGLSTVGCAFVTSSAKGYFTASLSWIMVTGQQTQNAFASVVSHESGHGFGLNHARSLDYDTVTAGPPGIAGTVDEYGDVFSNMAAGVGQWAASQKRFLGWFSATGNVQYVEAPGSFTIQPYETRTTSPQALRVRRGPGINQWFWLEYRQPSGTFDSAMLSTAFDGAVIHFEDGTKPPDTYSYLLDFNPSHRPNDFGQAPLRSGVTWQDPYSPLTLVVGNAASSGLPVSVAYDSLCAKIPSGNMHGPQAQSGVISVTAPDTCSWTVITVPGAPWITLTGAQSGSGNGMIPYSLQENAIGAARTGLLYIGRQPFLVTQQVAWPNLTISMTHSGLFAPGGSGTFTVTVLNSGSAATATAVGILTKPGPGLQISDLSGAGWTCSGVDATCWRSDSLGSGQSYPPLNLIVTVSMDAPATLRNQVIAMLSDPLNVVATASDVAPAGVAPDLTISMIHTAQFMQGDQGDSYILTVTNIGQASTSGAYNVVVNPLPNGLTASALSWDGGTCLMTPGLICSRMSALDIGQSAPPINLKVKVAAGAPATMTTSATVSGGGEVNSANNNASDLTVIFPHRRARPTP